MGAPNGNESPAAHYKLPDDRTVREAGELPIKDEKGNQTTFKSLYTDEDQNERQLIVFIRHFFCGLCEDYVRELARDLPPEKLASASVSLTIIGCGEPVCIPEYKARTGCPFPIYCDPSRRLYSTLGMITSLKGGNRPEYLKASIMGSTWTSLVTAVSNLGKALQAGNFSQNGGEWLFEGGHLKWCRRMRNTMDHSEVKELKQILHLEEG